MIVEWLALELFFRANLVISSQNTQEKINNRQKRIEEHSEKYELNERTYGTSGYPPLGYTSDPMYTS